eukprot:NODE_3743_length_1992_cov_13.569973.p1 GENE.NODE_3743_length_1992_cov_13.569973~~NODE_3743_length_1992_cov_13.569973.p1  ORF type:complete len:505 (-),score=92.44 NODE_3743_length_1992_cov_13.569973:227-1741(-)
MGAVSGSQVGATMHDERRIPVTVLCHALHNVEHAAGETICCSVSDPSVGTKVPLSVAAGQPVQVHAGIGDVLCLHVYVQGAGSGARSARRRVGCLSIPTKAVRDVCGQGICETWFILDTCTPHVHNSNAPATAADQFSQAMKGVAQRLSAPRICITMLDATTDPSTWHLHSEGRASYYDPIVVSHTQHLETCRAYTVCCRAPLPQPNHAELVALERELDSMVTAANQRLQGGNASIMELKAQIQREHDEGAQLLMDDQEAAKRLEDALSQNTELRDRVAPLSGSCADALELVSEQIELIEKQKTVLLEVVGSAYGNTEQLDVSTNRVRALVLDATTRSAKVPASTDASSISTSRGGEGAVVTARVTANCEGAAPSRPSDVRVRRAASVDVPDESVPRQALSVVVSAGNGVTSPAGTGGVPAVAPGRAVTEHPSGTAEGVEGSPIPVSQSVRPQQRIHSLERLPLPPLPLPGRWAWTRRNALEDSDSIGSSAVPVPVQGEDSDSD